MIDLPKRQQQLYDALVGRGDVPFDPLLAAVGRDIRGKSGTPQEWLGPYVTRLNRRLVKHGLAVKPGALKGTYRLTVIS